MKQTEFISNKNVTKNRETIKKKNQSISIQVMASGCTDTYCARVCLCEVLAVFCFLGDKEHPLLRNKHINMH